MNSLYKLRESFTSPHYTLYHYIYAVIHTSQMRSKGIFILLSDRERRLEAVTGREAWWKMAAFGEFHRPGGLVASRATWALSPCPALLLGSH
ncbi:hypothetical protein U9M48_024014, partial [Paspalum notatum var. saurae]